MPAAHRRRDARGVTETHPLKVREGVGVVLGAREHEVAALVAERRLMLEECGIVPFHGAHVGEQRIGEACLVGEAHEAGDRGAAVGVVRNPQVGLVLDHLQAVLEPAEEAVRVDQRVHRLLARALGGGERPERIAGRAGAQRVVAAAPDELLRLRVKLDLPNAAPAALDVVPGDVEVLAAGLGVDLPLDRLDVLDRREIEILAPDEGPQPLDHVGADRHVAGGRAHLDHGGAFPVLPVALVVLLRSPSRERERRGSRIGPELEVGAIDTAFVAALAEQGGEIAHEAVQGLRRLAPPLMPHAFGVEEHEQAELARIGKLARAEPAHAEHGQPARRRCILVWGCESAPRGGIPKQVVERAREHGIGEPGEGCGDPIEGPRACDVGKRDGQRRPPPELPKPTGEDAAVAARAGGARYLVERARERSARALLGHQAKLGRLAGQRPAEGRGVAEHALEEGTRPAIAIKGSCERLFVAAERDGCREPSVTTRARAFARDRFGANRID